MVSFAMVKRNPHAKALENRFFHQRVKGENIKHKKAEIREKELIEELDSWYTEENGEDNGED